MGFLLGTAPLVTAQFVLHTAICKIWSRPVFVLDEAGALSALGATNGALDQPSAEALDTKNLFRRDALKEAQITNPLNHPQTISAFRVLEHTAIDSFLDFLNTETVADYEKYFALVLPAGQQQDNDEQDNGNKDNFTPKALRLINLARTKVSDAGLAHLAQLPVSLQHLELNLEEAKVSMHVTLS